MWKETHPETLVWTYNFIRVITVKTNCKLWQAYKKQLDKVKKASDTKQHL